MKKTIYKRLFAIMLMLVMVSAAFLSACGKQEEEEEVPPPPSDPLTGYTEEEGFDPAILDKRIVAIVVENAPDARPQWGLDDPERSPDIVLQAEVEGGITRTLWFYSDYDKLPEIIGPTRSARPPFVIFSQFFDSIFIHWGESHSKGDYIGANSIFSWYDIDHINQMTLDDQEDMYGRDDTRAVNVEHRGIIYGDKVAPTIKNEGFRTTPEEYTKLYFNETAKPLSEVSAGEIAVTYSTIAEDQGTVWKYNEEDKKYHTDSFDNDFARDNLIVLYDDTEYITKTDYEGPGTAGSVTYCNYDLNSGEGKVFSLGSAKDVKWIVKRNKLFLIDPTVDLAALEEDPEAEEFKDVIIGEFPLSKDDEAALKKAEEDGDEEAAAAIVPEKYAVQPINKGKTWIGLISRNNGGDLKVTEGNPVVMPGEATTAASAE